VETSAGVLTIVLDPVKQESWSEVDGMSSGLVLFLVV
jgi:hypothetical protein